MVVTLVPFSSSSNLSFACVLLPLSLRLTSACLPFRYLLLLSLTSIFLLLCNINLSVISFRLFVFLVFFSVIPSFCFCRPSVLSLLFVCVFLFFFCHLPLFPPLLLFLPPVCHIVAVCLFVVLVYFPCPLPLFPSLSLSTSCLLSVYPSSFLRLLSLSRVSVLVCSSCLFYPCPISIPRCCFCLHFC